MNNKKIYNLWIDAWNKDVDIIDIIAHENCTIHQERIDEKNSKEIRGPMALKELINTSKDFFKNYKMSLVVDPIVDNDYIAARWRFTGIYNGKMEGAKAKEGTKVSFEGTDIFYVEHEKIKDYWVSSDGISFMKQLQVL
ncbi:ester cyclase [Staphylococcus durrellii]|uniref:ester cyclase n=1 Tax=Staphylococcus durrellii TaxID=2781773 RepID=UPI00189EDB79|nr:ester cyclase [Staphylococcus durrellii]MBF7018039.1 ester cyclase [Staphylococcus durrellii]